MGVSTHTVVVGIDQLDSLGYFSELSRETRVCRPFCEKKGWTKKLHGDRPGSHFFVVQDSWLEYLSLSEAVVLGAITQMVERSKSGKWEQHNGTLEEALGLGEATVVRKISKLKSVGCLRYVGKKGKRFIYSVHCPNNTGVGGKVIKLQKYRHR